MHNFGVRAVLLFSYAYDACIGWRRLAAAALLTPSTAAQLDRIHRRTRPLSPSLRRHLRTTEMTPYVNAEDVGDELRLADELTRPDAAKSFRDNYEVLLNEMLLNEMLFIHSKHKKVVRTNACAVVVDDQALLLRTIAEPTKLIGARIGARTAISYCEPATNENAGNATPFIRRLGGEEQFSSNERLALVRLLLGVRSIPRATNQCALDSKCGTIFEWKRVKINRMDNEKSTKKKVLIPNGCTCVINQVNAGLSDKPVVIFA